MQFVCTPSKTPREDEIDIRALKKKYAQERDRRVKPEGQHQYVRPEDGFNEAFEADPHMPVRPRAPISEDLDVAILGTGFTGVQAGANLKKAGVTTFRLIDHAGDFGGVWYWNRYPGIQCDNESYCYMPMLEETKYMPSKRFADGFEIQAHVARIADQFGLRENALFHTLVLGLRWDDSIQRWHISTNRGDDIRARFVVMCGGPLNKPKLPGIPGIEDFEGKLFHTARWDYEYTGGSWEKPVLDKLADKTVAIVGTGASAIQAVPYLAKYAKHLYVLQRTPSCVEERPNPPTDPAWVKTLRPGWQRARQDNFHRGAMERFRPGEPDLICDFWTEISRNIAAKLEARGWPDIGIVEYLRMRDTEDYLVMERLRRRVDSIVRDKKTAEALKPYFKFFCKRPLSSEEYYETFNRPNVELIDVSDTQGVERMTAKGFMHQGKEHPIDALICASGFEVTSDFDKRWGMKTIEGRNGLSLYKYWDDGFKTLHGMSAHGFPNQFYTGYLQGALNSSTILQFGTQGAHIAYIIAEALKRGVKVVEPSKEGQDAWLRHLRENEFDTSQMAAECTPSYLNNDGDTKKRRWYLGEVYGPGWDAFEKLLADWRAKGDMEGMTLIK